MRPYPWLPEKTRTGEPPFCQNCERYGKPKDGEPCGHYGWLCGNWIEARQIQLSINDYEQEIADARKGEE